MYMWSSLAQVSVKVVGKQPQQIFRVPRDEQFIYTKLNYTWNSPKLTHNRKQKTHGLDNPTRLSYLIAIKLRLTIYRAVNLPSVSLASTTNLVKKSKIQYK